jgi:hypothetical protein
MGFFSWKTSDTQRSICNNASERETFTVHMVTREGQVFTEKSYEGYGEFGGIDFYYLVAQLNGKRTRTEGIELVEGVRYVTNGTHKYFADGHDFFSWDEVIHDGKCANELVKMGWKHGVEKKDDVVLPKLVERLPINKDWKEWFDALPQSEECKYQGFFYDCD